METEVLEKRFGGTQLKPEYAGFKKAKAVVLQCPYDVTASYKKGTKNGPGAILEASEYMELFDEELKAETYKIGIHTKPPLMLEEQPPEKMIKQVKEEVLEVFKSEKMPVIIGGEHSVSIGAVSAASGLYKDLSVLHLDAHHDLRDEFNGSKYSHAWLPLFFSDRGLKPGSFFAAPAIQRSRLF